MAKVPFTIDSGFLQEVRDAVFRFACKYCGTWASADDCEDLTQQAMLELFEKVHSGEEIKLTSSLKTYVNGTVKNLASELAQKKARMLSPLLGQVDDDALDPVDMATAQDAIQRWQETGSVERQEELQTSMRELIENMPDPCKTILWAYYWEGKNMKEIAEAMGYTGKDVAKSQKSRCMTKVKEAMGGIITKLKS